MRAPDEQFATVGDIRLCFQTFGERRRPALLMIMGLGTQMIAWHDELCEMLARRGAFVIRYDNRDTGRSTRLDDHPPPSLGELVRRRIRHPAYTLDDLADDARGLLDALDLPAAHVVGASMGGMIAQTLAVRHPDRVASLTSMMSSTGSRWAGQPAIRAYPYFLGRPPRDGDAYVERAVALFRLVGSRGMRRDDADVRRLAAAAYERGVNPAGTARQLAAIIASGDRTAALRRVTAPTLVIHGTDDRLVRPSGGRATARAIPGARLMLVEGMGHDLPREAWPRIVDGIFDNAARANAATGERAASATG